MTKLLSGIEWRTILSRLASELPNEHPCQMFVVGGAAMALAYGSRRSTRDVDVVLDPMTAPLVLEAARRVAPEFGLASGWLNENAKAAGYVSTQSDGPVVFEAASLVVRAASLEHLLAMKVAAWRDQADIDDAVYLLGRLRSSDVEATWNLIGGYVPLDKRSVALNNLHEAWDVWTADHGSP